MTITLYLLILSIVILYFGDGLHIKSSILETLFKLNIRPFFKYGLLTLFSCPMCLSWWIAFIGILLSTSSIDLALTHSFIISAIVRVIDWAIIKFSSDDYE